MYFFHSTLWLSLHESPLVKRSGNPHSSPPSQLCLYISVWSYKACLGLKCRDLMLGTRHRCGATLLGGGDCHVKNNLQNVLTLLQQFWYKGGRYSQGGLLIEFDSSGCWRSLLFLKSKVPAKSCLITSNCTFFRTQFGSFWCIWCWLDSKFSQPFRAESSRCLTVILLWVYILMYICHSEQN